MELQSALGWKGVTGLFKLATHTEDKGTHPEGGEGRFCRFYFRQLI